MAKLYYIRVKEEDLSLLLIVHLKPFLPVTFSNPNPPNLFLILSISRNVRTTWNPYTLIYYQIPSHHHTLLYLCQTFFLSLYSTIRTFFPQTAIKTCRAVHTDLSSRPKAVQTDAMFARKSVISSSIDALHVHSAYANSAKTSVDSKSCQDDSHKWVSMRDPPSTDRSLSGEEEGGASGFILNGKLDINV